MELTINWIVLLSSFIWTLYSAFEGFRESFYWWFKMHSNKVEGFNMHIPFTIQRGILFITLILLTKYDISFIIYSFFSFSFIHNGIYYLTRKWISNRWGENNPYPKGFWDQSNNSESFWTKWMTPFNRTLLFILGICIIIWNKLY